MTAGEASEAVGQLTAAVARLLAAASWQLPEAELVAATGAAARLRAALDGAYLALVAELDGRRSGSGGPGGGSAGTSTEGFLRSAALLSAGQARRDVEAARAVHPDGPLAGLAAPLSAGEITRLHVDVAVRCLDRIPVALRRGEDQVRAIGDFFVRLAPLGTPRELEHAARQLRARLDPDGVDRFDPAAGERRFLDLSTDAMGMLVGRFQLDAASGAVFRAAVDAGSAPLPAGPDGAVRDGRTPRQRRADALVHIGEVALGASSPSRGERPRVVVHVSADDLVNTGAEVDRALGDDGFSGAPYTESGHSLDRATARRLACDAVVHLLAHEPGGARVLAVGREHRLATSAQRKALAARDRACVIPGCGAQPAWCDAHHVRHWADGGETDLDNLVLLCPGHHTAVHAGRWRVRVADDGVPVITPPPWVDPRGRPRRGMHHEVEEALRHTRAA